MSAKCNSQNCNRKPDTSNQQNLCVLCYDWYKKCQEQTQLLQQQQQQNIASHQELVSIYNNVSNGIYVDPSNMMKALLGSMINLINQNSQMIGLKEENIALVTNVKNLENEVIDSKAKVAKLEKNIDQLERKSDSFSTDDSLVIRNLAVPADGDEMSVVRDALIEIEVDNFDIVKDIIKVERKGAKNGKLGSVLVKLASWAKKKEIMKKKKNLMNNVDPNLKELKIMNFKTQEQILFENALRGVLSLVPNGSNYEINGNTRLVQKRLV